MLPITFVAAIPGPPGAAIHFAHHTLEAAPDGQLRHFLDGALWATVPPEGMKDYAAQWPQAADLVAQLLRRPAAPAGGAGEDPGDPDQAPPAPHGHKRR